MKLIRLTKVGVPPNPVHEPGDKSDYQYGQEQSDNKSLPIEYTVDGLLIEEPVVGEHVTVLRNSRNGVPVSGFLRTSRVTKVTSGGFETQNSIYKIEVLQK